MGEAARLVDAVAHRYAGGRWLATGGGGYDAYRVVPRIVGLVWLAGAHREVPTATPAGVARSVGGRGGAVRPGAAAPRPFDDAPNAGLRGRCRAGGRRGALDRDGRGARPRARGAAAAPRGARPRLVGPAGDRLRRHAPGRDGDPADAATVIDDRRSSGLGRPDPRATGHRAGRRRPTAHALDRGRARATARTSSAAVVGSTVVERWRRRRRRGASADGELLALGVAPDIAGRAWPAALAGGQSSDRLRRGDRGRARPASSRSTGSTRRRDRPAAARAAPGFHVGTRRSRRPAVDPLAIRATR